MNSVVDAIKALPKKEPAVLIGALLTLVSAIAVAIDTADVTTWQAAIPVIVGVIIRQFVVSPATAEKAALAANAEGQVMALSALPKKKTKKATSVPESSPSPKPKVQKRSKKPVHVNPVSKQTPTKQP